MKTSRKKIEKLTWGKIGEWFKANLKGHPIVLGLLFFVWLKELITTDLFSKDGITYIIVLQIVIAAVWLVLAVISNLLQDKPGVKWYFRKRFVLFMFLLLPPLGIVLAWAGAGFKRATKITFTLLFGLFFISATVYYNQQYKKLINESALERIIEIITQPKKATFLKTAGEKELEGIQFISPRKRATGKLAISAIANKCIPATVAIKTKNKNGEKIGEGSGFVVSPNGFVVTNLHVVEGAYAAEVKIGDIIYSDVYLVKGVPSLDIAILKIDAVNLAALPIGNSDVIISGQAVVVLGNPGGFERSVSEGIVSAVRSKGERKFIQITAPVSPGSSGGPVLNEYGEVVGIATVASFLFAQNLNFAIPINDLKKVIHKQ